MMVRLTKPNPQPEAVSYTNSYAAASIIASYPNYPVVQCAARRTTSVISTSTAPSAADDGHARVVILGASAAGVVKRTLRRCSKSTYYFWWWKKLMDRYEAQVIALRYGPLVVT